LPSPCREYEPAEDTFLLCDYVEGLSGRAALDIGSGSGYVTRLLERSFEVVVGTDIDHCILKNQTYPARNRVCCNAADALRGEFDVIVSNPPYLDTEDISFPDTDGGPGGVAVPGRFLRSAAPLLAPGGAMGMVVSSLSRHTELARLAASLGLKADIAMRRRLFYEELYVLRLTHR